MTVRETGFEIDKMKRRNLVSTRVGMLITLFGRRVSEDGLATINQVYGDALEGFPIGAISSAFTKVEQEFEKLPSPKVMKELCQSFMMGSGWKYDFVRAKGFDPETGESVDVLIDPDPTCRRCRNARSDHPFILIQKDGQRITLCEEPVIKEGDEIMYRPQHCPEGRAFLAKLKEIAGKK